MNINKPLLIIISFSMLILIVIFPQICIDSAVFALTLWFSAVIPSLLPFFIGAGILSQTGVIRILGACFQPVTRVFFRLPGESAYVFIASALSGYPMGAKICSELYREKTMDLETAQRTICFTSIGGPLFILGTVAYGLLRFSPAGFYIVTSHYLGAIAAGLLLSLFYRKKKMERIHYIKEIKKACRIFANERSKTIGEILESAVSNSITVLLLIGGTMVLFNVIIGFLQQTGVFNILASFFNIVSIPKDISHPVLTGMVEMTTGCQAVAQNTLNMAMKIPVIAFIISFGGMSVHAQTFSIAAKAGLKLKFFLAAKTIQAFSSFIFAFILLQFFPLTQAVFQTENPQTLPAPEFFFAGTFFALFALAIMFISFFVKQKKPA